MVMMAMAGMVVSASDKVTAVDDGDSAIIHTLHPSVMVSFMYTHNLPYKTFVSIYHIKHLCHSIKLFGLFELFWAIPVTFGSFERTRAS